MESDWAVEHLQTIRTLMERSALYRRTLAPIMIFVGTIGFLGAAADWLLKFSSPTSFVIYWFALGLVAATGAFLLVRRQAWRQAEPIWSPPARRVLQAMLPPLTAGVILGLVVAVFDNLATEVDPPTGGLSPSWLVLVGLPAAWIILYGCALHSAGFFMPRGMKLFGWAFVVGGSAVIAFVHPAADGAIIRAGSAVMGLFFGVLHLAYGAYLALTEKGKNAA